MGKNLARSVVLMGGITFGGAAMVMTQGMEVTAALSAFLKSLKEDFGIED